MADRRLRMHGTGLRVTTERHGHHPPMEDALLPAELDRAVLVWLDGSLSRAEKLRMEFECRDGSFRRLGHFDEMAARLGLDDAESGLVRRARQSLLSDEEWMREYLGGD